MDWTAIYDADGEESDAFVFQPPMPMTRMVSFASEQFTSGYDSRAAYIFTINYILGVGCLGIPFGFARAGLLFGSLLVCFVSVLAYASVCWVAETVGRAEELARMPCEQGSRCWLCTTPHCGEKAKMSGEAASLLGHIARQTDGEKQQLQQLQQQQKQKKKTNEAVVVFAMCKETADNRKQKTTSDSENPRPRARTETDEEVEGSINWSKEKSYEVTELCKKFLGKKHSYVYQLSLLGLMYVGLLAYSQVFSNAVVAIAGDFVPPYEEHDSSSSSSSSSSLFKQAFGSFSIPALLHSRSFLAVLFSIIVVPLSCLNLEEQVSVQAFMAIARFVAIFSMVFGSIFALFFDPVDNDSSSSSPPYLAAADPPNGMSYTFSFSGFGMMFSTALFSQLFQHSVPGIIRPLPKHQKRDVKWVFAAALGTTCAFYLLLGVTAASYFGKNTKSSINLNFTDFKFGIDPDKATPFQLLLCSVISTIVVLFPALDTLSVFPLIANTLGSNLAAAVPQTSSLISDYLKSRPGQSDLESRLPSLRAVRRSRARSLSVSFWRCVASVPPIVFSVFASDLALSLQLAGVCGLYVAFVAPALLQLESRASARRVGGDRAVENVYSGWHSKEEGCYAVLAFSAFALVVVCMQIRETWIVMHVVL